MQGIVLDDVTKAWPGAPAAVDHLDLAISAGEFVGLVGPSGCGKTTVLRILCGLEAPTSGRVLVGSRDITNIASRDRYFGLVTQQNQLLGHLSAGRNICFPLEVRQERATVGDIDQRLRREASRLGLESLLDRRPSTLSEGQRRRVQLARAVIGAPVALMLDEPLANLEDQVRARVRAEIVATHHDRGLTSLMATADQRDAMAMCDRIAVLVDGRLEQYATPADVYDRPATVDVADFFGEPSMNILAGRVDAGGGGRHVSVLGHRIPVTTSAIDPYHGGDVVVGVRPEDLVVGAPTTDGIEAVVRTTESVGYQTMVYAEALGVPVAFLTPGRAPRADTVLDLAIPPDRLHFFDPRTRMAIHHPST
ncbi:MAG: ABC transporter ATP-binding protein [Ilumatobacter sp.]|uniref:ABC transporter ATP-binding protein n=2 Tax=Ilumatobacter sp. TaxID=1967498 RepID=UPI003296D20E